MPPQVQDCVSFAREQCVDAYPSLGRKLCKCFAFDFIGDEYFPLLRRKFFERVLNLLYQNASRERNVWAGIE